MRKLDFARGARGKGAKGQGLRTRVFSAAMALVLGLGLVPTAAFATGGVLKIASLLPAQ